MFTLKNLNVVRIVNDECQKSKLIAEGFIEIIEKPVKTVIEDIGKKVTKTK